VLLCVIDREREGGGISLNSVWIHTGEEGLIRIVHGSLVKSLL
jgi:hypothetical protein